MHLVIINKVKQFYLLLGEKYAIYYKFNVEIWIGKKR